MCIDCTTALIFAYPIVEAGWGEGWGGVGWERSRAQWLMRRLRPVGMAIEKRKEKKTGGKRRLLVRSAQEQDSALLPALPCPV